MAQIRQRVNLENNIINMRKNLTFLKMKFEGRKNNMGLKIGVCGLGNAGSQVAVQCNALNIPTIGVNSSEMDIDAVRSKSKITMICFGQDGAGLDRNLGKSFVKDNMRAFLGTKEFKDFIDQVDYVFMVSSTSGGTGSSFAPIMTDVLTSLYTNGGESKTPKYFINVGILPHINESIGNQRNTIEYLKEVTDLGNSYLLFDNNNVKTSSTDEIFTSVNKKIAEYLAVIRGDYSKISPYGMIDDRDFKKIILMPGMIFMNKLDNILEENIKTDQSIEDMLLNNINQKNYMVTIDRDKIVKRRGCIANLAENLRPYFDRDLNKISQVFGEPIEQFNHFAINEDSDSRANYVILIMSGLSLPNNRLRMIIDRVSAVEQALAKKQETSLLRSAFDKVKTYSNEKEVNITGPSNFDLDDIMGKY